MAETVSNIVTFANNPNTTVATNGYNGGASHGGTPASATAETWTVTSSSSFPAASSSVIPTTGFHIANPALPNELILVTNISGTTWSVTRGVESTTTYDHAAGATFYQVVSAGDLANFKQAPTAIYAPTTVTSTTETVLANYTVPTADFITGSTFEIVAFGPLTITSSSARTFQLAVYWGGSGSVGGTFTATGSTKLAWIKTGTNAAGTNTTVIAGNSWDMNASITLLSSTTAAANMNLWYSNTITVAGVSATTTNTNGSGLSAASAVGSISGSNGPIIVTAVTSNTGGTTSITAVAPFIYRTA